MRASPHCNNACYRVTTRAGMAHIINSRFVLAVRDLEVSTKTMWMSLDFARPNRRSWLEFSDA
jgi:hypothetical protein